MSDTYLTTATTSTDSLMERLLSGGWKFQFFQAIWLLERFSGDQLPVGGQGPVEAEALRFRPDVSLGFPPSDIRRISRIADPVSNRDRYLIDVSFLGVYGVCTPLPIHYAIDVLRSVEQFDATGRAEQATDEQEDCSRRRDVFGTSPLRDFLDIFHHRIISLFYRSWLKYRYHVAFSLPTRAPVTEYLLWLIGCPSSYDPDALGLSSVRMIRYAGILTQRPRSAALLEGMLRDYWIDLDVAVEQCVGRWVPLAPSDRCAIGSLHCGLGVDLTVGEQIYDLTGAFSISIGPVDWETYLSFLPDGACFAQTRSLVRLYCTDPLFFNIELKLRSGEVPEMMLSSDAGGARLGFTSWVRTDEVPDTSVVFSSMGGSFPIGQPDNPGAEGSGAAVCEAAGV